jgi:hypothetical protein
MANKKASRRMRPPQPACKADQFGKHICLDAVVLTRTYVDAQ